MNATKPRLGSIWYDATKSAKTAHRSGLQRVAQKLRDALGEAVQSTQGIEWARDAKREDYFLTAEVFSPRERLGFTEALAQRPCGMAAIFHDAIPLKYPHITWPASVGRHPAYMKMLASFDLVLAVSEASREELLSYWAWLGMDRVPRVETIRLGSDFCGLPRVVETGQSRELGRPVLLCVGIIEPRKNQCFLLDVCERLWSEGADFELHVVGRVNPHFGGAIEEAIKGLARQQHARGRVHYHKHLSDEALGGLYARATASVFPTIAEGCGLPLLESLWWGVPCLCSDIPSVRENAAGGGTLLLPPNNHEAWERGIREITASGGGAFLDRLRGEAVAHPLLTWADTAKQVLSYLSR